MDYSIKNNYTRGKYSSAGTTYVSLAKQQRRKAAHLIWVFYSQEEGDDQDQYCQRRQIFEKPHRPSLSSFFFSIFSSVANSASFIQLSHFSSPFFFRGWLMLPKKTNGGREEGKSQGGETQKFDDDENKVASKA